MANSDLLAAFGLGGSPGSATGDAGLNAFSKLIGENNIYRQAAAPVLSAQFNTTGWSPAEIIGSAAIKAFLGATLNRLGAQSEGDQLSKVAAVMPQLTRDPASVMLPEGVDPAAFNILKLAEMSKQGTAEESTRRSLADKFISYDPATGRASAMPGAAGAISEIFSAQNEAKGEKLTPRQQEALSKALRGEDLSKEDADTLSEDYKIASLLERVKSHESVQERFDTARGDKQSALDLYGWERAPDAPKMTSPKAADRARILLEETANLKDALQEMKQAIATDNNAQFRVAASNAQGARKNMLGAGASYTASEQKLYGSALPTFLTDPTGNWGNYFSQKVLGIDPTTLLDELGRQAETSVSAKLRSGGWVPKGASNAAMEVKTVAPAIPAGMKLQRNKLTGETRIVPIGN